MFGHVRLWIPWDGVDLQAAASLDLIEMLVKSEGVCSPVYIHTAVTHTAVHQEVVGIANDERASVVNFSQISNICGTNSVETLHLKLESVLRLRAVAFPSIWKG